MKTDKPKRGRPPLPPEERRDKAIYVKVSAAEKALIDAAIDEPSVYARKVLLRAAQRRYGK